jgi:hypothetical protein
MKSSMAAPIEAPTAAILRYQPANCILRISPSEEPEAAVAGDTCVGGFEVGDDGREGAWQSQILAVEVDAPDLLLVISNNAAAPTRFQVAAAEVSCSRWFHPRICYLRPSSPRLLGLFSYTSLLTLKFWKTHELSLSLKHLFLSLFLKHLFFIDHKFYLKTLSICLAQNGQI